MRRRDFLLSLASTAFGASAAHGQNGGSAALRLKVNPDHSLGAIGPDFLGLSYETAVLSDPSFFAGDNDGLVAFFRRLGRAGVLRIGGNTSEYGVWTTDPASVDLSPSRDLAPDTGKKKPPRRAITPEAIRNLRDFADATGWSVIYGLNLGGAYPEGVAAEARYVFDALGPRLSAFQIGNEPDLFGKNGLRNPDYDFDAFAREWQNYSNNVRAPVPGAVFGGPDTAVRNDWLASFAGRFGDDVRFLSSHYYAEGPPSSPSSTIENLLAPDNARSTSLFAGIARARELAPHTPFRLTETNSCYNGGKPGVSNTFAAALWGAELTFRLAAAGGAGINFHGGGDGWYTPIAGSREKGFAARPLYYGLIMFAQAGAGRLVECAFDSPAPASFGAYTVKRDDGGLCVALFNKGDADLTLAIDTSRSATLDSVLLLSAPTLDATDGVTLGGATVGANAAWMPAPSLHSEDATIAVPRASAALAVLRMA